MAGDSGMVGLTVGWWRVTVGWWRVTVGWWRVTVGWWEGGDDGEMVERCGVMWSSVPGTFILTIPPCSPPHLLQVVCRTLHQLGSPGFTYRPKANHIELPHHLVGRVRGQELLLEELLETLL